MSVQHYMKSIQNARRAMVRAHNPKFRQLWSDIADKLHLEMVRIYG